MKTLLLRFTVSVEFDAPDDFPVANTQIERVADWIVNDYSDGRYPHSTEDMHHAAIEMARVSVSRAISDHYDERIEKHLGRAHACAMSFEIKNSLADRCEKELRFFRLAYGHNIEIAAMEHPLGDRRYTRDSHLVISRDDTKEDGSPGDYKLATRTVFEGREAAEAYARTVASSREAIVVPVPLSELRIGEDRGRLDYWAPTFSGRLRRD